MNIYILIYSFLIFLGVFSFKLKKNTRLFINIVLFIVFIIFIGLRDKVGGDWESYLTIYYFIKDTHLNEINFLFTDPAYLILNWLSAQIGEGIYLVNFICAFIFVSGLIYFIEYFKLPYIAYLIAFPYLIVVVSMGYTRQSVALALLLFAYVQYAKNNVIKGMFFILLAMLFHKTAIIGFIVFLSRKEIVSNLKSLIIFLIIIFGIYTFMENKFISLLNNYFFNEKNSSGALIRNTINLIAVIFFFIFKKRFKECFKNSYNIWLLFSIISIILYPFTFIASTMSDRLMLYFIPLQIVVFSKIPFFIKNIYLKTLLILSIIIAYTMILLVWLNFSLHRLMWIPYNNILFN